MQMIAHSYVMTLIKCQLGLDFSEILKASDLPRLPKFPAVEQNCIKSDPICFSHEKEVPKVQGSSASLGRDDRVETRLLPGYASRFLPRCPLKIGLGADTNARFVPPHGCSPSSSAFC